MHKSKASRLTLITLGDEINFFLAQKEIIPYNKPILNFNVFCSESIFAIYNTQNLIRLKYFIRTNLNLPYSILTLINYI